MVFWSTPSSRSALSSQQALEFASNICLDNARKAKDSDVALQLCDDAEVALSHLRRANKVSSAGHTDDQRALSKEIANVYIELGRLQNGFGQSAKAQANYKRAELWGEHPRELDRTAQLIHHSRSVSSIKDASFLVSGATPADQTSLALQDQLKQSHNTINLPQEIFAENVRPPAIAFRPPEPDEPLIDTLQLSCCLGILRASQSPDIVLEPLARDWLQAIERNTDEQERLKMLARDVIRVFKGDEIKDTKAIAEVIYLASVLEKDDFRYLLKEFYSGVDQSDLLNVNQLEGLADLISGAEPGYLNADDLVKLLELLSMRLRNTHQQSSQYIYRLTRTVSRVLDAMAETKVKGLDREKLHEPLSSYLDGLKGSSDPYLVYQAAYAYQALQYVPDNETPWQATLRRTGKVIQGVSGLVSAVKGMDLNGFIDGLGSIQQGLTGASEAVKLVRATFAGASSLAESGQDFLGCLKEGLSFTRKCAWYPALRGADTLLQEGQLAKFRRLVCEAPCRFDPAFQWGVCQRLGEVAANSMWEADTRRGAIAFLGEIYLHDEDWGQQMSVQQWILNILKQLSSDGDALQTHVATALLQELEANTETKNRGFLQACREKGPSTYPLKIAMPSLASPSLLDHAQNRPDVEGNIRLLRKQRLKERGNAVYIPPQAKASLQAPDEARFPLMEKVKEFLDSDQKVFLLLGDSGAGKSTFNRELEYNLWGTYRNRNDPIPLHINLPAIEKPEQDMIAKQLQNTGFTEAQIKELKACCTFIVICDGYDESQQTRNLYVSNQLNQPEEWKAQMVISCRSEYIGADYRDRFQPGDRNHRAKQAFFQEAVISAFSPDQVQDYIKQYVSLHQPLWKTEDYQQTLDLIPSLKELVKNPFLLTLSLEVLPRMVDPGQRLSATRVTRVALYDQFVEQWLERGKKRLGERELSHQTRGAFESLSDEGFALNGLDYLKKLSVAIYKEQEGQPIVEYSRFKDEGSWKAAFFSREDETLLLREASPLTRSGNQYRFIHRSILEYGLALAIFDPRDIKKTKPPGSTLTRRGSVRSVWSFEIDGGLEEVETVMTEQQPAEPHSPLVWRSFVKETSILQFLSERVQQEDVFKKRLLDYIEHSKTDKLWRIAASNAMTILVRAGVQFNGVDMQGIRIPGADLSYGVFHSAQMQGADLRKTNLRGAWLHRADLSRAQMTGVQFGEMPFLKEDSEVFSCAFSPNGESFAVGLSLSNVRVYTTSTWERLWTLSGHTRRIECVVYSPTGDEVASASSDDTVRLWDLKTGTCRCVLTGHDDSVTSVAYSPHGDLIASASADNTVRIWNVETEECRSTLTGHTDQVFSVVFSPYGNQIASSSADHTIRLWNVETLVCCHVLVDHSHWVRSVVYSPQGDLVASANDDCTIRIWDVETGACRNILSGHGEWVKCVAYSPQGDTIASASNDKTVRLWNVETGACLQTLTGHNNLISSVVFSPKGDKVATSSNDRTVRLWDVEAMASRHVSTGHSDGVLKVKYSPTGGQFASCSRDKTIRLWDMETGSCRHTLRGHTKWVVGIVYSNQGDRIASASEDETVRLWDSESGTCQRTLRGHSKCVYGIAFSPQGDLLASGSFDKTLKLWDVRTGDCHHTFTGHTESVLCVVYSPKGGQMASGSADKTVRLWDAESKICSHVLSGHRRAVRSIVYSPLGDMVASASDDETVRLWAVDTGACLHTLTGHKDEVCVVTYSPEGDQLVSCSMDETVKIWNTKTGECLRTLTGHDDGVRCVAFSPQGDLVASSSYDKTVRLWDVATGHCLAVIQDFLGWVFEVAWIASPNLNQLLACCNDGSLSRWQMETEGDQHRVQQLWRSTDGKLTMTGAIIQDVVGLSKLNRHLLSQREAVGEPGPDEAVV